MSCKVEVRPNGRAYPVLVCDHCGTCIEHIGDGNALWLENCSAPRVLGFCDVYHTHKLCNFTFEHEHRAAPGSRWMFNDLDAYFFLLLLNTRYEAKKAKRKAKLLATVD